MITRGRSTRIMRTSRLAGHMLMQMRGRFAGFERAMIRERTEAGLAAARGRVGLLRQRVMQAV